MIDWAYSMPYFHDNSNGKSCIIELILSFTHSWFSHIFFNLPNTGHIRMYTLYSNCFWKKRKIKRYLAPVSAIYFSEFHNDILVDHRPARLLTTLPFWKVEEDMEIFLQTDYYNIGTMLGHLWNMFCSHCGCSYSSKLTQVSAVFIHLWLHMFWILTSMAYSERKKTTE